MTAGGDLTVRVANRRETSASTLLGQISVAGRVPSDGHLIGPPRFTFSIDIPFPDRPPSKIHV